MENIPGNNRNEAESIGGSKIPLRFLRALGITILAFLMSFILASPISFSVSSLFSSPDKEDTQLSDFYAQVANRRPVRQLDPEVVAIDIRNADREEIARLMEIVGMCEPKAVGLDVMFGDERDGDERLIEALKSVPNLVMPLGVEVNPDETVTPTDYSYFHGNFNHEQGIVNLASRYERGTIREFPTWFRSSHEDSIPSFPVAIALTAHPEVKDALIKRNHTIEFIDYPSREFEVIPIEEAPDRIEELMGKIIMIGSFSDASDLHSTPIASMVPGVLIHTYALSTINTGRYYSRPGIWGDWLLAFVLCLFTVWISMVIDARVKGLVVRLIQLVIVYLTVQIGYYLFVDQRIVINFTYTLLMITFGTFASDIWHGAIGAVKMLRKRKG